MKKVFCNNAYNKLHTSSTCSLKYLFSKGIEAPPSAMKQIPNMNRTTMQRPKAQQQQWSFIDCCSFIGSSAISNKFAVGDVSILLYIIFEKANINNSYNRSLRVNETSTGPLLQKLAVCSTKLLSFIETSSFSN